MKAFGLAVDQDVLPGGRRRRATAAKRSSAHNFDGQPAPGLMITGGRPSPSVATNLVIRAAGSGQEGIAKEGMPGATPRAETRARLRSTTCAASEGTRQVVASHDPSRASAPAGPMRGGGHRLESVAAVGRRGVHVQVAAQIREVHEVGKSVRDCRVDFSAVLA